MLDLDSEDIDGKEDDVGDEHELLPIGRWTATSSYDIYMVDTPKESNRDEATEDNPLERQVNNWSLRHHYDWTGAPDCVCHHLARPVPLLGP